MLLIFYCLKPADMLGQSGEILPKNPVRHAGAEHDGLAEEEFREPARGLERPHSARSEEAH